MKEVNSATRPVSEKIYSWATIVRRRCISSLHSLYRVGYSWYCHYLLIFLHSRRCMLNNICPSPPVSVLIGEDHYRTSTRSVPIRVLTCRWVYSCVTFGLLLATWRRVKTHNKQTLHGNRTHVIYSR
jgi:hypothetical protein